MNRAYKLVWNVVSNSWIVVSELAKGRKKSSGTALKLALCVAAGFSAGIVSAAPAANALPTGEKVASGRATFDRSISNQLTVNQSSSKLITNWNSFDIGSSGKVEFVQPDASSIALNRITKGNATQIFGQLSANGQLVLVNPNGITFGAGSQVSAASIIGSVLNIQDSDFNTGNLYFAVAGYGFIDNQGGLTARAGSVSLLSPRLTNSGTITAQGGNIYLINARYVNLNSVEPSIVADSYPFSGYMQQSGQITATQVSNVGGRIVLLGNMNDSSKVALGGTLHANDTRVTANQIQVTGVLAVDGANHQLSLNSSTPYTLNTGSKINLNGIHSGFSVNGNAYTVIRDINQLQAINTDLAGRYVLGRDVNASATSTWNAGAGFVPIGNNSANGFSGVLDGLGHSVNGLVINTPKSSSVGLIGSASAAQISNIGLKKASIHGWSQVGGLVGNNSNTAISNSYAIGSVRGSDDFIGGLIGQNNNSNISNSYANGSVTGGSYIGGLVGWNNSSNISNSYVTGHVSGYSDVGGLVGNNSNGAISNSHATGDVQGFERIGGLVGNNSNTAISNSYAIGSVRGSDDFIGGLIGQNNNSNISNSYANGSVTGGSYIGGLVGRNNSSNISNSYVTGHVSGYSDVGGLVGNNSNGAISNSHATGDVQGSEDIGGLVGYNSNGAISNSHATGDVQGSEDIGGLVGNNFNGAISNSHATGDVQGSNYIGGLVGWNQNSKINNSYASGNIASIYDYGPHMTGGLVGWNESSPISNSYATGNVGNYPVYDGFSLSHGIGGLVGYNSNSTINSSYASGRVRGGIFDTGGLVGVNQNGSNISNSYASGNVNGLNNLGGLVGSNSNSNISNSDARGNVSGNKDDSVSVGGLVGASYGTIISNSNASGRVRGNMYVGGLVGWNERSIISDTYASGSVWGKESVGGLVGSNHDSNNIDTSYASGSVRGNMYVGGLVGWNERSIISDTYASGSVWGSESVGGLVGVNSISSVITSYASGSVRGGTAVGGLAGLNEESLISKSYWQDHTQGRIGAVGINTGGVLMQVTGLSSSQIKQSGSFASWGNNITAELGGSVWRIYEGQTAPMLRAFLKPLQVSIHNADASKTYDGTTYSDLSYTLMDSKADASKVLSNLALRNAGSYSYSSGLYSTQHGYDLYMIDDGTYTITPRALTLSTVANSKVYDGGVTSANKPVETGLITGDRITGLLQQYETKTVGENKKLLIKNGYVVQDGNNGSNYVVTEQGSMDGVITAH